LSTGKFLDKMGINLQGSHNWSTLLNNYFKATYFDAITSFIQKGAKNETIRAELSKLNNSTVGRPTPIDNPVAPPRKPDGVESYFEHNRIKK